MPSVALYARVSTDDQAERGTIDAQVQFLGTFCSLYSLDVADRYLDDGVSGTLPLSDRPEGRRLLADAALGRFETVLVYRVDRLGRSIRALLDAHEQLKAAGVAIRSATEPFDTATAIGQFLFTLLGSLAELDRATIIDRMTLGRDRRARDGYWTNGPVPFGYDLTDDRRLLPSSRVLPHGQTEADLVRDLFARIADGATLFAEQARFRALGVPRVTRWPNGQTVERDRWWTTALHRIVVNPIYRGVHVRRSRHGTVEAPFPALVPDDLWFAAQRALVRNRSLSTRPSDHPYLLRGLLRCGNCGRTYAGWRNDTARGDDAARRRYRCTGAASHGTSPDRPRCPGRVISARDLDAAVWADVTRLADDPFDGLAPAADRLEQARQQAAHVDDERQQLERAVADLAAERERALLLYQSGRADLDRTDRELSRLDRETLEARRLLAAIQTQQQTVDAAASHLEQTRQLLDGLRTVIAAGSAGDLASRRFVVETLVAEIVLTTSGGTGRQRKRIEARIRYRHDPGHASSITKQWRSGMPLSCVERVVAVG